MPNASDRYDIRQEIFPLPPAREIFASTYYTHPQGLDLISIHQSSPRSDTVDGVFSRRSSDNGRTWSKQENVWVEGKAAQKGMHRRFEKGSFLDPKTGRFISFRNEADLPTDEPLEGMRQWKMHYRVSEDGGRTWKVDEPIIHRGAEYSAAHPLPNVWVGKNCFMIGDLGSEPITLADGTLLVPIQISPIGPDGVYYNPGGGFTYSDAAVLRGRWTAGAHLEWELSALAKGDPAVSTRGTLEPTIAQLTDKRLIMVMRGSNDKKPQLFGGRWVSFSNDEGRTWTKPELWTYTNGEKFFSPSSCSQLVTHSSGRLFWLGNITPQNPVGNRPRYPLVIGEVDRATGRLREETVAIVADRRPQDSEQITLSNFYAREDRETRELVLHLSRGGQPYLYRIKIK